MKILSLLFLCMVGLTVSAQGNSRLYLEKYGIYKDSINELSFKNEEEFKKFISAFEVEEGFELPKFLIIDNTGKLLKHRLDVLISQCGKGDVSGLKKKYFKDLPDLKRLNTYLNEQLVTPQGNNFIVIFIWHEAADKYNKHTFETYHAWKEDDNITFYFLDLNVTK
ncbi:hypothetical protein [Flavobacterium sp.]|uniref:hypothetical protein n=1 Tax=Flavobacterium sp. TaxID=239 RepID=UPI002625A5BE|nr:hypothetical protein [Flavobacterium sp.]